MKLALFDVDGTLMDSQAMILASMTSAFTPKTSRNARRRSQTFSGS